jgi:ABC-type multidrug transport system permease subunit
MYYNGFNVPQIGWGIFIIFMFIIAALTTVFGVIAIRRTEYNSNHSGRGIAITGLWLGGIGLFLTLIGVVILYLAIAFSS